MSSVVSSIFGGSGNAPGQVQSPLSQGQIQQQYGNLTGGQDAQQALLAALQAQNGIQNQSQVYNQLQQIASGEGPNPAQAMLNQATGANVANQAALMAGQRGASANPGLIARLAAQQGANTQQQAAGQAATLQANQALNAINAAGNMANTQTGNLLNTQQQYNQNALNALNTGVSAQNQTNAINSQAQQAQANMQGQLLGQLAGAAGTAIAGPIGGMLAGGGGGGGGELSSAGGTGGGLASGAGRSPANTMFAFAEGGEVQKGPRSHYARMMANGGKVEALVSPGEQYLPPKAAQAVAEGRAAPFSVGQRIPGKPMVAGNSYMNDTVPKTLSEGGVVIPNSIMQAKDAEKKAAEFVRAVLARKKA